MQVPEEDITSSMVMQWLEDQKFTIHTGASKNSELPDLFIGKHDFKVSDNEW